VYEAKNVNYWKDEIATSQGDMRRLWRTLHSALGEMTDGETGDQTADEFATFFLPIRSIECVQPPPQHHCMTFRSRTHHCSQNGPL